MNEAKYSNLVNLLKNDILPGKYGMKKMLVAALAAVTVGAGFAGEATNLEARARVSSATAAWFAIACEGWLSGLQRGS